MSETVTPVVAAGCLLGEGPVWDAAHGCLWFTDIKGQRLHRFDPATGAHEVVAAPGPIGWVLPCVGDRLMAGIGGELHLFTPAEGAFELLGEVFGEPAGNRLNDACSDRRGGVFFGSMHDAETDSSGQFYRFDRGAITRCGLADVCITNGPAVSPDGSRVYFTDTLGQTIHVAEVSPDGGVGPARLFVDVGAHFPDAYPDGPVCDAEGGLWSGLWNGWGVAHFSPDGDLVEVVRLPVANVTKVAFGGPDLRRVFVTTARKGLDEAALAAQPHAGDLFAFDGAVAGCPAGMVELI